MEKIPRDHFVHVLESHLKPLYEAARIQGFTPWETPPVRFAETAV